MFGNGMSSTHLAGAVIGFVTTFYMLHLLAASLYGGNSGNNNGSDRYSLPVISTVKELDVSLDTRLLFIGDIHGHSNALEKILRKTEFDANREDSGELVVLVGDFLTKGPHSREVAEYILKNKESVKCILGNNDLKVLYAYNNIINQNDKNGKEEEIALRFATEEWSPINVKDAHYKLANELSDILPELSDFCSTALKINIFKNDQVSGKPFKTIISSHAGILPGNFNPATNNMTSKDYSFIPPIESIAEMKYVDLDDWDDTVKEKPEDDDEEESNGKHKDKHKKKKDNKKKQHQHHHYVRWYKLWEDSSLFKHEQDFKQLTDDIIIIYGHDAGKGLNIRSHTKGLDSGCGKGKTLTSLELLWDKTNQHYQESLFQVDCDLDADLENRLI